MALTKQGNKQFPLFWVKFDQKKNSQKFPQIGDFCRIVESLETFAE
jgi:hypothetical protein